MKTSHETMWRIYGTLNEWIRFSDAKAGAILATNGVIAGAVFSDPTGLKEFLYKQPAFFIPLMLAIATECLSIYFSLRCLNPTLRFGESNSLIFFVPIAQKFKTATEYESVAKKTFADDKLAIAQITEQVWANSKVSWKKYEAVTWATRFLVMTIFISIASILAAILL